MEGFDNVPNGSMYFVDSSLGILGTRNSFGIEKWTFLIARRCDRMVVPTVRVQRTWYLVPFPIPRYVRQLIRVQVLFRIYMMYFYEYVALPSHDLFAIFPRTSPQKISETGFHGTRVGFVGAKRSATVGCRGEKQGSHVS